MHDSVQAALHAMTCEGVAFAHCIALKPSTWHAGHNAGRDDARTARERLARPPAGTALAPPSGLHPESTLRRTSGGASTRRASLVKKFIQGAESIDPAAFFCGTVRSVGERRRNLARIKTFRRRQLQPNERPQNRLCMSVCYVSFAPMATKLQTFRAGAKCQDLP
jgi:hypothetical protein